MRNAREGTRPPRDRPAGASTQAQLASRGLRAKRSLGQNFLHDPVLCDRIAALSDVEGAAGSVLEIGAGLGALTERLLLRRKRVIAVETDRDLCEVLRERFRSELADGRLQLLQADVREVDLPGVLERMPGPRTLAGNLPYQLSGLLLRRAVEAAPELSCCAFLLQLEVVTRLCARPSQPGYGALSVFVQAAYEPRKCFTVKRGAFYPQPGVDSATVRLEPRSAPVVAVEAEFAEIVRAAFEQRRKTLRNAWKGLAQLSPRTLEQAARAAGIDLAKRGETLSVAEFAAMADEVRAARAAGSTSE